MKVGLTVTYVRTLAAITVAAVMLGAVAAAAGVGDARSDSTVLPGWRGALGKVAGHGSAAIAGTVRGIAAAREARRAYRRDHSYAAPFPAPYYPYQHGYPYW